MTPAAASPSAATGCPCSTGIDWQVAASERWVILGPNGSGKTTLLQVAGARLWPTSGRVEVLGERLGRVDVRTLRPRVALVSGAVTRQLRADVTAREVVASGRHGALETWWHTYTAATGRRPTGSSLEAASARSPIGPSG